MATDDRSMRFAAQVLPCLGSAYRLARWLTHSHEDAEEVVQEACLQAFRAFDGLRGADARPWLLAIVRHAAFACLRKRHGVSQHELLDEDLEAAWAPTATLPIGPEAVASHLQDAARLHRAIARLPMVYREVLVLREFEDMTYQAIAKLLDVPAGTVMSRLARARQRLLVLLSSTPARGD
jgi:RNA polymerase sigma-70 factor, ECF subfamily